MGNKIITEKDFWICTGGAVPAQLQTTQLSTKKVSGHKYITINDKATSSWIDFGCMKLMLIMAILAAVIAALIVATGGAALAVIVAAGAIAGAAGAAFGAVVGALICGQKAAAARQWLNSKSNMIIQGQQAITGDHVMKCHIFGDMITFAPHIKNWWQAIALGAANYIGGILEGMLAGAAVGLGVGALFAGGSALAAGGLRGLGQASLGFLRAAPMNILRNMGASFGYAGGFTKSALLFAGGLRGTMGLQGALNQYGNTGSTDGTGEAFGKGFFGIELGLASSVKNVATGQATWQDIAGLALMLTPVHTNLRNKADGDGVRDGEPVKDGEEAKPDEDGTPTAKNTDAEAAKPEGEFEAFEQGTSSYKGFGGDIILDPNKTTTVIGKFTDTVDGAGTGAILDMPEGSFSRGGQNKGGINILDIPSEKYQALLDQYGEVRGKEIFWEQYNQPFLENAFKSGDNVRLLSDPSKPANRTGFYERELREIEGYTKPDGTRVPGLAEKYGYVYDPVTNTYVKK